MNGNNNIKEIGTNTYDYYNIYVHVKNILRKYSTNFRSL